MKLSIGITTHNETTEIDNLLSMLFSNKRNTDEIVILDDYSKEETINIIKKYPIDKFEQHKLNEDFASHKNYLNGLCTGDFIFQLDADEIPSGDLFKIIDVLIKRNKVDLLYVPRANFVVGIRQDHLFKWGWKIDEKNRILWPDYQSRIYRNCDDIKWENPVHETVIGFKTYAYLPADMMWTIYHEKKIEKQEKQNKFYLDIIHKLKEK